MLIHLMPYISGPMLDHPATLIDLSCEQFSLRLDSDQISSRRPYPNKNFVVACRRHGLRQRALFGFFIETPEFVPEFTMVYRWAIKNGPVGIHRVHYVVLDRDFDAVSEKMSLWGNFEKVNPQWSSRWPANVCQGSPMESQPRFQIFPDRQRWGEIKDKHDARGFIIERSETFYMPTLSRERLIGAVGLNDRMPTTDTAFHAGAGIAQIQNNVSTHTVLHA